MSDTAAGLTPNDKVPGSHLTSKIKSRSAQPTK